MPELVFEPIPETDHFTCNGDGVYRLIEGCTRMYEPVNGLTEKEVEAFYQSTHNHVAITRRTPKARKSKRD